MADEGSLSYFLDLKGRLNRESITRAFEDAQKAFNAMPPIYLKMKFDPASIRAAQRQVTEVLNGGSTPRPAPRAPDAPRPSPSPPSPGEQRTANVENTAKEMLQEIKEGRRGGGGRSDPLKTLYEKTVPSSMAAAEQKRKEQAKAERDKIAWEKDEQADAIYQEGVAAREAEKARRLSAREAAKAERDKIAWEKDEQADAIYQEGVAAREAEKARRLSAREAAMAHKLSSVTRGAGVAVQGPEATSGEDEQRIRELRERIIKRMGSRVLPGITLGRLSDFLSRPQGIPPNRPEDAEAQREFEMRRLRHNIENRAAREFAENLRKTHEPLSAVGRMFKAISEGGIRRGVAMGVSGGLGGGPVAAMIGGFTGALASSLALPIAWALGNVIMQMPGMAVSRRESEARFRSAGRTPEEQAELEAIRRRGRGFWAAESPDGVNKWMKSAEALQDVGIRGPQLERTMNRLTALSHGAAGGGAAQVENYAEMVRTHTPESRWAMIEGNVQIENALYKMYRDQVPGLRSDKVEFRRAALKRLVDSRRIGNEDIDTAMELAANDPLMKRRLESTAQSMGGGWRNVKDTVAEEVSHPLDTIDKLGNPMRMFGTAYERLKMFAGLLGIGTSDTSAKNIPGLEGTAEPGGGYKFHPERGISRYSWSSASGLAEQMQMMWSGVPIVDATVRSADSLSNIDKKMDALVAATGRPNPVAATT